MVFVPRCGYSARSQCLNGVGDGGCTGSGSQCCHAALQRCDAFFKHILCGVGQTAVDIACIGQISGLRRALAVAEHIRRGLVDGHRTGIGGGVGLLLTDMKLQGLKFIFRHCYLPFFIY